MKLKLILLCAVAGNAFASESRVEKFDEASDVP